MDNNCYRRHDMRSVVSTCRGVAAFFAVMDVLGLLVILIVKGPRIPYFSGILPAFIVQMIGVGLLYLHFANNMVRISESGIERTGQRSINWDDISKVTITKRIHARSQCVDTIIYIFYGRRGLFKMSSGPEETAQILLLLKRYIEDKLVFDEARA